MQHAGKNCLLRMRPFFGISMVGRLLAAAAATALWPDEEMTTSAASSHCSGCSTVPCSRRFSGNLSVAPWTDPMTSQLQLGLRTAAFTSMEESTEAASEVWTTTRRVPSQSWAGARSEARVATGRAARGAGVPR